MSQPTIYTGSVVASLNLGLIPPADSQPLSEVFLTIRIGGSLGPESPPVPMLYNPLSPGFQQQVTLQNGDNVFSISSLAPLAGTLVFQVISPQVAYTPGPTPPVLFSKALHTDAGEQFAGWVAKGLCYAPGSPPTQWIINNPSGSPITGCILWLL